MFSLPHARIKQLSHVMRWLFDARCPQRVAFGWQSVISDETSGGKLAHV